MKDDAELLRRYLTDRSQEAFAELVRRHLRLVYSAARLCLGNDPHLAEDVTQQVFTTLALRAASVSGRSTLAAWLYSTTRFTAIDLVRSERRRKIREARVMSDPSRHNGHEEEWNRLQPLVGEVLDQLRRGDREAVLLRFFEGLPFASIGAALGVTENAARKRVEHALDRLRLFLARRGVKSTGAALATILANHPLWSVPASMEPFAVAGVALSSAAAGGKAAVLAGFFHAMNTSKIALALGCLISTFVVVGTITENRERSRLDAQLGAANRAYDRAASHLAELKQQLSLARNRSSATPKRSIPFFNPGAYAAEEAKNNGQKLLAASPRLSAAWSHFKLAQAAASLSRLLAGSSLTPGPEAMEKLSKLESGFYTPDTTFTAYGIPYTFPQDESHAIDLQEWAAASGGEITVQQFAVALNLQRAWALTGQLAAAALDGAHPLSPDQIAQVAQVVAKNATAGAGGGFAIPAGKLDAASEQAQALLSPQQMADFAGLIRQQRFSQALSSSLQTPPP